MIAAGAYSEFAFRTSVLRSLLIVFCVGLPAIAFGQAKKPAGWNELRPTEPPKEAETQARRMISDGTVSDPKLFDGYWRHFIAQITWFDKGFADPPKEPHRVTMRKLLKGRKNTAQERLVRTIALPMLKEIAEDDKYDVRSRVNALLWLGQLNRVEPSASGPAVALPDALDVLIKFVDPKLPVNDVNDALRNAAMSGLEYHASHGGITNRNKRQEVARLMQQIADQKDPPQGRDADVHAWLVRDAQEVLNSLKPDSVVAKQGARVQPAKSER